MKKIILFLGVLFICTSLTFAEDKNKFSFKINTPLSAKIWITTKKPMVTVSVEANIVLKENTSIRDVLLSKLNELAPADWKFITIKEKLAADGSYEINTLASARLENIPVINNSNDTHNLHDHLNIKIESVTFEPSFATINEGRKRLRDDIYNQVKDEISRLSKIYPEQKFSVYSISFIPTKKIKYDSYLNKDLGREHKVPITTYLEMHAESTLVSE